MTNIELTGSDGESRLYECEDASAVERLLARQAELRAHYDARRDEWIGGFDGGAMCFNRPLPLPIRVRVVGDEAMVPRVHRAAMGLIDPAELSPGEKAAVAYTAIAPGLLRG